MAYWQEQVTFAQPTPTDFNQHIPKQRHKGKTRQRQPQQEQQQQQQQHQQHQQHQQFTTVPSFISTTQHPTFVQGYGTPHFENDYIDYVSGAIFTETEQKAFSEFLNQLATDDVVDENAVNEGTSEDAQTDGQPAAYQYVAEKYGSVASEPSFPLERNRSHENPSSHDHHAHNQKLSPDEMPKVPASRSSECSTSASDGRAVKRPLPAILESATASKKRPSISNGDPSSSVQITNNYSGTISPPFNTIDTSTSPRTSHEPSNIQTQPEPKPPTRQTSTEPSEGSTERTEEPTRIKACGAKPAAEGGRKRAGSTAKPRQRPSKPAHELLTDSEKKANHIASEQRRRQHIRNGFDTLCELVPTLSHCHRSEALILQKSVEYIGNLLASKDHFKTRIRYLRDALGEPHSVGDDSGDDNGGPDCGDVF